MISVSPIGQMTDDPSAAARSQSIAQSSLMAKYTVRWGFLQGPPTTMPNSQGSIEERHCAMSGGGEKRWWMDVKTFWYFMTHKCNSYTMKSSISMTTCWLMCLDFSLAHCIPETLGSLLKTPVGSILWDWWLLFLAPSSVAINRDLPRSQPSMMAPLSALIQK